MAVKTLKINGREYAETDFNDTARTMLRNIAITDEKIRSLKQELALFQVARETFGTSLLAHLPGGDKHAASAAAPAINGNTASGKLDS